MNRTKVTLYICCLGSAALTLAGMILRTVFMISSFDADIGYFKAGAPAVVCQVLSVAAVLFSAVACMIIPKGQPTPPKENRATTWASLLPGLALAFFGICRLINCFQCSEAAILPYVLSILALGGAAYFFLAPITSISRDAPVFRATVGLCLIFWALASVADTYFDLFTTMNSPIKTILQFGFLSIALLSIAELRISLNKATPRMAVCAHCLALYFGLTGGVSTLVAALRYPSVDTQHTMYAVVLLACGLYAAVRLGVYVLSCSRSREDTP